MNDEAKLPREELLRKLLKMTTATNDGECLTAIRKANELLRSAGWDWDKLLDGKIKIIENPFSKVATVNATRREFAPPPPKPTTPPAEGMMWEYNSFDKQWDQVRDPSFRKRRPPMPGSQTPNFGGGGKGHGFVRSNNYPNSCWCCGDDVAVKTGVIFNPQKDFGRGLDKWQTMCEPCNQSGAFVPNSKAPRTYQPAGQPQMGAVNLGSL